MNETKFMPFPILHTPQLKLRQLTNDDRVALFKLRNDESVSRFISRARQKDEKEAAGFIERINSDIAAGRLIFWAVCLNTDSSLIGSICLWNFSTDEKTAELGYELLPEYQAKGLMTEAVQSVTNFGFSSCLLDTMEAYTHRVNQRSKKLLIKFGFELVPGKTDPDNLNNTIYILHNQPKPPDFGKPVS